MSVLYLQLVHSATSGYKSQLLEVYSTTDNTDI